ncbi:hypothetical protein KAX02_09765 [candidate division WOR-3 bacterium]|nr:hypothetical protein [candidate division WOR-3 bacterium]
MKKLTFLFPLVLLIIIACNENPLQPPSSIRHGTGSCDLTENGFYTFTFPGGDYGEFQLEHNSGYVYIHANGVVRVVGDSDTAPAQGYLTCEVFEWTDEESYPYYYFLKTDDAPHYAKVQRTGDITKEIIIFFEWWLQTEEGNRNFGD